jgi:hypothetical protein
MRNIVRTAQSGSQGVRITVGVVVQGAADCGALGSLSVFWAVSFGSTFIRRKLASCSRRRGSRLPTGEAGNQAK